jgi:hypothetical protein
MGLNWTQVLLQCATVSVSKKSENKIRDWLKLDTKFYVFIYKASDECYAVTVQSAVPHLWIQTIAGCSAI